MRRINEHPTMEIKAKVYLINWRWLITISGDSIPCCMREGGFRTAKPGTEGPCRVRPITFTPFTLPAKGFRGNGFIWDDVEI